MRRKRDEEESAAEKEARKAAYKQAAVERALAEQEERARKATEAETVYGMQAVDKERAAALHAATERQIKASMALSKAEREKARGTSVDDKSLIDDLFGGGVAGSGGYKSKGKKGKAKAGGGGDDGEVADEEDNLWGSADADDDDFWVRGDAMTLMGDEEAEEDALFFSGSGGGGGKPTYTEAGLGALGAEAAAVQAGRKTQSEMEFLTDLAFKRKEEAAHKAEAAKTAKAKEAEAASAALDERRAAQRSKVGLQTELPTHAAPPCPCPYLPHTPSRPLPRPPHTSSHSHPALLEALLVVPALTVPCGSSFS